MRALHEAIDIAAPVEVVWAQLADFEAYGEWNPFVVAIEGEPRAGSRLRARLQLPGSRAMTLRPRLLAYDPPHGLRWLGHLGVPGIFDGEHSFALEPTAEGGTHFVQREEFRGVMVPLVWRFLAPKTRAGFTAMNEALRARAEASVAAR